MEGIDRTKELNLLKTARGQMDGIIKMLEEGRYCIDISKQVLAVQALLKKANLQILEQHMHHCVTDALKMAARKTVILRLRKSLLFWINTTNS